MDEKINIVGAAIAVGYFASTIMIFVFRLWGKIEYGHWIGLLQSVIAIPIMTYLVFTAQQFERSKLYYIQAGLMLLFLIIELLLDYILKIEFRQIRWMVISYVTLFFAAMGGMLGIASYAGRGWSISAVILFFVMAILAFVQRAVTGL